MTRLARAGNDASIGRVPVVVRHGGGDSDGTDNFNHAPDWDFDESATSLGSGADKIVTLGEPASRTQGNPIIRSTTAPFTVTGRGDIESNSRPIRNIAGCKQSNAGAFPEFLHVFANVLCIEVVRKCRQTRLKRPLVFSDALALFLLGY